MLNKFYQEDYCKFHCFILAFLNCDESSVVELMRFMCENEQSKTDIVVKNFLRVLEPWEKKYNFLSVSLLAIKEKNLLKELAGYFCEEGFDKSVDESDNLLDAINNWRAKKSKNNTFNVHTN